MMAAFLAAWAGAAGAQDIKRTELPNPPPAPRAAWPIVDSVAVPAGATTLFVSGKVPQMANPQGARDAIETYGDTFTQADNVLKQIAASLERAGFDKNDVVQMNVYLVPDPKTGRIDFAGFSRAYDLHFGTRETPNRPARSTIGIAQLINPGWLVEIDVIAARAPPRQ
jgi:enamine deaminase RidA (YjgF/YER057c/UK114 family)